MVSTRVNVAKTLAEHPAWPMEHNRTVQLIFKLEACGFRVVKAEETLEYHGIPKPGDDEED